jgi:hypothetical protein
MHIFIKNAYKKLITADRLQNELLRKEHRIATLEQDKEELESKMDCLISAICIRVNFDKAKEIFAIAEHLEFSNKRPEIVKELEVILLKKKQN